LQQLEQTIEYIKETYPDIPVILDSKRADIGNTNEGYVCESFDWLNADAVTVSPYLGVGALAPLFAETDKGIIVLCRTSNVESAKLQNIVDETTGLTVYETVAEEAKAQYNETRNVLLVVGATNPEDELAKIRERVGPEMIFLVPGVGAQGGDIEKVMNAGLGDNGRGVIINSSREIIFAGEGPEFAAASLAKARETRDKINQYR
jgi:orotidine-5'-phosphate decarboxylase